MDSIDALKLIVLESLIACTCLCGDWALQHKSIRYDMYYRAPLDSFIHGVIGFLCWCCATVLMCNIPVTVWFVQAILCMFLACLIDTDHFIAAESFNMKDALSLQKRPAFHNSTLIPVITICLWMLVKHKSDPLLRSLPWIFLVGWTSHHIRDATRRGLWFAPVMSTPPLPRWLYVGLTMLLPLLVSVFVYGQRHFTEGLMGVEHV